MWHDALGTLATREHAETMESVQVRRGRGVLYKELMPGFKSSLTGNSDLLLPHRTHIELERAHLHSWACGYFAPTVLPCLVRLDPRQLETSSSQMN